MRVLYVFLGGNVSSSNSGVQKKIIAKIKALNYDNVTCDGISLSDMVTEERRYNEHVIVIPFKNNHRGKFFRTYQAELSMYKSLITWLESNSNHYDVILFRYPLASWGLYKLVKRFPGKIVFEHNTKEIEEFDLELKKRRKKIPFQFKLGYFVYLFEIGYLPGIMERYLAPKIFRKCRMGVSVTKEIAEYETHRCKSYHNQVVSNGIDVNSCKLRSDIVFDGKELRLFMLLGYAAPWHGVRRLVKSLEKYNGPVSITVDLIGQMTNDDVEWITASSARTKINIIESVPFSDLDKVLDRYHAGIGSLATFEKKINEASPLKVREYFARGFPCIIGYHDTDLSGNQIYGSYYLQVPVDESLIDFNDVVSFIACVYQVPDHPKLIRKLAFENLDTSVKMRTLINGIRGKVA